jgi:glycosyl transferase family 1
VRIFLGTDDVAFFLSGLAKGLRRRGHEVTTMVEARTPFAAEVRYDIVRGRELYKVFDYTKAPRLVRGIARRIDMGPVRLGVNTLFTPRYLDHDVFILFRGAWLPDALLLPVLRRANKKVLFFLLGSEARHVSAFSQEYGVDTSAWRREFQVDPLDAKIRWLRHIELNSDIVYSVPDQAGLQVRPYYHAHIPLDVVHELPSHVPDRRVPRVLHAPSRDDVKGTSIVMSTAERLKQAGVEFELKILSGVPRHDVLAALADADILVDELLLHGPGTLAAEAMASGVAVATRTLETSKDVFDPPVCSVRPENLFDRWRRLVEDVAYRKEVARRGREWALRQYDPEVVAARVESHFTSPPAPDYVPDFYLSRYRLPAGAHLSRRTKALTSATIRKYRPDAMPALEGLARRGLALEGA